MSSHQIEKIAGNVLVMTTEYLLETAELASTTDPLLGLKPGEVMVGKEAINFDFYAVYETEVSFTPFL